MGRPPNPPQTTFTRRFKQAQGYQVPTPYGIVTVTQDGRLITFALWQDVRQSVHHRALFSYYQELLKRKVKVLNVDHLDLPGMDLRYDLDRGKARLDLVYESNATIHEVELKTHREVGLEQTAKQLRELVKYCTDLIIVVPRADVEEMRTILTIIGVDGHAKVDTYQIADEEQEPNDY